MYKARKFNQGKAPVEVVAIFGDDTFWGWTIAGRDCKNKLKIFCPKNYLVYYLMTNSRMTPLDQGRALTPTVAALV